MDEEHSLYAQLAVRWPEVIERSWELMTGASRSSLSAWRNGRVLPRPLAQRRLLILVQIRSEGRKGLGAPGFQGYLGSYPHELGGRTNVLSALSAGRIEEVLGLLRDHLAFNRTEDARIEKRLRTQGLRRP